MIVAITSKGGAAGCTTITIISALTLKRVYGKKVCIVDLKNKQAFAKILKLNPSKRLDYLITDLGFMNEGFELKDNIQHYGDSNAAKCIDVILGSIVPYENHLLKCVNNLKVLLEHLNTIYDFVIIDVMDNKLLSSLKTVKAPFFTVNVLSQDMLLITEYQTLMKSSKKLDGLIVVNAIEDRIYPQRDIFNLQFGKGTCCFLPRVSEVKNILNSSVKNRGILDFNGICKLPSYYSEIKRICSILINRQSASGPIHTDREIDDFFGKTKSKQKVADKKTNKSLLSRLFKRGE